MANYDRRILLPYLHDVCSVELLLARLQKEYSKAEDNIFWFKFRLESDKMPEEVTDYHPDEAGFWMKHAGACLVIMMLSMLLGSLFWGGLFGFISFLAFLGAIFFFWLSMESIKECNKKESEIEEYKRKVKEYEDRQPERDKNKNGMIAWEKHKKLIGKRCEEVKRLRDELYRANIIPKQYRNLYATHYLYEYFESSQETDLDRIIQTFVLEEIKTRLDRVIDQQTEIILNQRCIAAKQEQANEQIASNHAQQMRLIADLQENAYYRTQYLHMINSNLAISNYFAYNDYIRKS